MLPKYTFALGGSNSLKELKAYIESGKQTIEAIERKYKNKVDYAI